MYLVVQTQRETLAARIPLQGKKKLESAQQRYNKNYYKHVKRDKLVIKPNEWMYLHVERRDESQTRHKLADIAEGPFLVTLLNVP